MRLVVWFEQMAPGGRYRDGAGCSRAPQVVQRVTDVRDPSRIDSETVARKENPVRRWLDECDLVAADHCVERIVETGVPQLHLGGASDGACEDGETLAGCSQRRGGLAHAWVDTSQVQSRFEVPEPAI